MHSVQNFNWSHKNVASCQDHDFNFLWTQTFRQWPESHIREESFRVNFWMKRKMMMMIHFILIQRLLIFILEKWLFLLNYILSVWENLQHINISRKMEQKEKSIQRTTMSCRLKSTCIMSDVACGVHTHSHAQTKVRSPLTTFFGSALSLPPAFPCQHVLLSVICKCCGDIMHRYSLFDFDDIH